MSEAEDRYLVEISADCETVLGAGIQMLALERVERADSIGLVARYQLGDVVWESVALGETIVRAHAALRDRLLFDRIRLGFTALVEAR